MKTYLLSLALLVSAPSLFAHSYIDNNLSPRSFSTSDPQYLAPESVDTLYLDVKGMEINGFTGSSLTKIHKALEVVELVVNSDEFKEKVLNFKNDNGERAFASNNGLSNEEIYARFMEGRETLQPDTPGEMNFYLKLYKSPWYNPWSKVIGYTTPDTNVININKKYFGTNKVSDVAGNLAHEWTHKIGFDHKSAAEHDSAPYAIGYIVKELAKKYE